MIFPITNSHDVKQAFNSLCESVWVFSVLTIFAENHLLTELQNWQSSEKLQRFCNLPSSFISQSLNVLKAADIITEVNGEFKLASSVQAFIHQTGLENFIAQLQNTFGLTNELIRATREKKLPLGWHYHDETILQSQGIRSEYIVTDCAAVDSRIVELLSKTDAKFLDVGAGVGKISLKMCEHYSNVKVVALEPADKPYSLAKKNIEASPYQTRIELRKMFVENLNDQYHFDVIWFPHIFFDHETLINGLRKVKCALKPNGILLTTTLLAQDNSISLNIRYLINTLYGGLRKKETLLQALKEAGFSEIKEWNTVKGYQTITAS